MIILLIFGGFYQILFTDTPKNISYFLILPMDIQALLLFIFKGREEDLFLYLVISSAFIWKVHVLALCLNSFFESFFYWLENWYEVWKDFLKEKTENPLTGKSHFTHRRLRNAYFGLRRNLDVLFTFQYHSKTIKIPNTTNSLEGYFTHLKNKLAVHQGFEFACHHVIASENKMAVCFCYKTCPWQKGSDFDSFSDEQLQE